MEQIEQIDTHKGYSFFSNVSKIKDEGWMLFSLIVLSWVYFTDLPTKIESVISAATYSYIEYSWYTFTLQTPQGIEIAPLSVKGRKGFTSVEQFIANILYVPIALHAYLHILSVENLGLPFIIVLIIRTALFPFNIWILEIIQAEIIKYLMGFNPAWDYTGNPGSFFGGDINLRHWKLWILLGFLSSVCHPPYGVIFVITMLSCIHYFKIKALKKRAEKKQ